MARIMIDHNGEEHIRDTAKGVQYVRVLNEDTKQICSKMKKAYLDANQTKMQQIEEECISKGYGIALTYSQVTQKPFFFCYDPAKIRSIKAEKNTWRGMMSIAELSEKTGISIDCLKSYNSGRRDLRKASYETVEKIADALGVDIRSLV